MSDSEHLECDPELEPDLFRIPLQVLVDLEQSRLQRKFEASPAVRRLLRLSLAVSASPFGIDLVNAGRAEGRAVWEASEHGAVAFLYEALLVRPAHAHHWFALRRIAGHWFRLDSQAAQPAPLSQP